MALTALGGRLYYLAVLEGDKYKLRADKNRISLRWLTPERGEIFDRNGKKLATNRLDFRVFLIPERAEEISNTIGKLGRIIHLEERHLRRIKRQIKRQRKFLPVTIAQGLDWTTFSKVNVATPDLPGVITDAGLSRYYLNGQHVAHMVGYMAAPQEDDISRSPLYQLPGFKVGRQGLEKRYEEQLRGVAGSRRVEVNALGREIRELPPRRDAISGASLHLTLDIELQRYTAELLGEEAAGVVAMDVNSGEILAAVSTPSFDPNEFTQGISSENWQALLKDPRKPLVNKCVAGQYPPGSTFKPFVALAALEAGVVTPQTEFYCNGKHRLGNHVFHCWKRGGHGKLNLVEGISKSCDVYFYKMAELLDIERIADMARRFGLGQAYDIGIDGEKEGLVPDPAWKRAVMNDSWHLGETLNVSIGQGALLATPLQLAVMTSRLASGRMMTPALVRALGRGGKEEAMQKAFFDTMDVSPLYLQIARRGMEMVTEPGGTAHDYRRAKSKPKQAGKTGTAQVRRISKAERDTGVLNNNELPWAARDHALFIGYAPTDKPEVAVAVLIQHGGSGSRAAAPVARAVMDKALELRRAQASLEITMPQSGDSLASDAVDDERPEP